MTNDQTAMLARYGIDYAEAMERFCGNESLFARIAVKYLDDPHVDALEAAMASGDAAAAEREAHSLKGVAGNLSFVCLYDLAARVTGTARQRYRQARTLMPDLRRATSPCWKR
ncbi:MAG: Hpt domain-containing protein [Eggerthella lenta]